jgi:hypothetical protein
MDQVEGLVAAHMDYQQRRLDEALSPLEEANLAQMPSVEVRSALTSSWA